MDLDAFIAGSITGAFGQCGGSDINPLDSIKTLVFNFKGYMKMEAVVLYVIGLFKMNIGSTKSLQEALGYFGSAIALHNDRRRNKVNTRKSRFSLPNPNLPANPFQP